MCRTLTVLGATLEAVVSGMTCVAGNEHVGLIASSLLVAVSFLVLPLLNVLGDSFELPDVMSVDELFG